MLLKYLLCPLLDKYQVSILRKLRDINMDYHHVGWYQSTYLGSHVTKEFLESHVDYQRSIEESVVLIYGKGMKKCDFVLSDFCYSLFLFFNFI